MVEVEEVDFRQLQHFPQIQRALLPGTAPYFLGPPFVHINAMVPDLTLEG